MHVLNGREKAVARRFGKSLFNARSETGQHCSKIVYYSLSNETIASLP